MRTRVIREHTPPPWELLAALGFGSLAFLLPGAWPLLAICLALSALLWDSAGQNLFGALAVAVVGWACLDREHPGQSALVLLIGGFMLLGFLSTFWERLTKAVRCACHNWRQPAWQHTDSDERARFVRETHDLSLLERIVRSRKADPAVEQLALDRLGDSALSRLVLDGILVNDALARIHGDTTLESLVLRLGVAVPAEQQASGDVLCCLLTRLSDASLEELCRSAPTGQLNALLRERLDARRARRKEDAERQRWRESRQAHACPSCDGAGGAPGAGYDYVMDLQANSTGDVLGQWAPCTECGGTGTR